MRRITSNLGKGHVKAAAEGYLFDDGLPTGTIRTDQGPVKQYGLIKRRFTSESVTVVCK
jgi:hypothetical protein